MIILVNGATRTLRRRACPYLGHLLSPMARNHIDSLLQTGLVWAADNGAYSGFNADAFQRMLRQLIGKPRCLFVVAPDVVADAAATLELFDSWQPIISNLGLPVALVGQDGQEALRVPWDRLQAFFIGGSTEWKLSQAAARLAIEAKRQHKWLHMGRVNSLCRLRYAYQLGCDSVDGSRFSWFPDHSLPRYLRALQRFTLEEASGLFQQFRWN